MAYARPQVLVAHAGATAFRKGDPGPRDPCTRTDHRASSLWLEQRSGAGVGETGEVGRGRPREVLNAKPKHQGVGPL